jgi:uncharacterized protein YjdB
MKSSVALRVVAVLCAFVCFGMALGCGSGGAASGAAKLTQISISPANQSIPKGTTLQLSATGVYDDGNTKALDSGVTWHRNNPLGEINDDQGNVKAALARKTNQPSTAQGVVTEALGSMVTWQTSQPAVAMIDSQGLVTAMSQGVAQLSATYEGVTGTTPVTVGQPALLGITVSPKQSSLPIGESARLTATGSFSDGSTQDLSQSATWSSSVLSVANVNAQGVVVGTGAGVAQLSAAYQGMTGSASITVGAPALLSITVSPNQTSLPLGEFEQLAATGSYSDGSTQNLTQSAIWSSSIAGTANVNAQGVVTGISKGVAQISASYQGATGNAEVAVGAPALVTITVSPNQSSLPVGETRQLTATGNFSDGSVQNLTQSATWISSGSAIASVNTQGVVTAAGAGAAQVSATSQGITGSASVTVAQPALLTITISPNQSSLPLGESEQLTATGNFSDGSTRSLVQSVTWTSSSAAASVSAQGIVTGTSLGIAQVSAVYQGITGSASVTVGAAALLSITVSPSKYSLPAGESTQLSAIGTFSNGTTQSLTQSATWSSSSAIASVNGGGAVFANAVGTSTITASAGSVTGSASLTVTSAVVVSLNIIPATISLVLENSTQLQAMANMSDGTIQNLTARVAWSSAQPGIASVTSYGYATAQQVGKTTIQAESNGTTGSASLTVLPLMAVSYFNLANARQTGFDDTVRLANPGLTSGNLCAMVYVFNSKQVMNECCGCTISDSGLLTLSLANDLTSNTLTGKQPVTGVIEVVPSNPGPNGQCNAASLSPNGVILGWGTNVLPSATDVQVTEETFAQTQLSNTQASVLAGECSMIQQLGSGAGVCSCGTGGN